MNSLYTCTVSVNSLFQENSILLFGNNKIQYYHLYYIILYIAIICICYIIDQ